MIGRRIVKVSGKYAERDPERGSDDHRGDDQLHGRRKAEEDILGDRAPRDERGAHVAAEEIADIDQVALGQAAIEPPARLGRRDRFGIVHLAVRHDGRERIAFGDRGQQEGERDDAQDQKGHRDEPLHDVACHGADPSRQIPAVPICPSGAECRLAMRSVLTIMRAGVNVNEIIFHLCAPALLRQDRKAVPCAKEPSPRMEATAPR